MEWGSASDVQTENVCPEHLVPSTASYMTSPSPIHRASQAFQPTPPPEKELWRVTTIERLETLLSGGLWFARLDQFGDMLEGTLPRTNSLGLLDHLPPEGAEWVRQQYHDAVLQGFALCWHVSEDEASPFVWDTFSNPTDGVAVHTTVERLRKALEPILRPDGPVHMGAVRYVDHTRDRIPDWNVIEAAFVVQDSYSDEREVRALIHTVGTAAHEVLPSRSGPFGPLVERVPPEDSQTGKTMLTGGHNGGTAIVLSVDPADLIVEVVPDRRLSGAALANLRRRLQHHSLEDKLRTP